MDRMLVATDRSARSSPALARAIQLARQHGAALTVVNIIDEDLPEAAAAALEAEATSGLAAEMARLDPDGAVSHSLVVRRGEITRDLTAIADEVAADLIILGMHRARPFLDLIRETTMQRLVRANTRPILLVAGAPGAAYKTILNPLDYSPAATAAQETAAALAPDARVISFTAYQVPYKGHSSNAEAHAAPFRKVAEGERDAWLASAAGTGKETPSLMEGAPMECLGALFREHQPELIALGAHARATLSPWQLGSLTTELIQEPPCDVLVCRAAR